MNGSDQVSGGGPHSARAHTRLVSYSVPSPESKITRSGKTVILYRNKTIGFRDRFRGGNYVC